MAEKVNFLEDIYRGRNRWVVGGKLLRQKYGIKKECLERNYSKKISFSGSFMGGIPLEYLNIVEEIWKKEIGILGKFCELYGVKSGKFGVYLVVKPKSSAIASELNLRSFEIVRKINKHFSENWIKAIKLI